MVLCWLITSQHHPPLTLQGLRRVLVFARYKGTPRQVALLHLCVPNPAAMASPQHSLHCLASRLSPLLSFQPCRNERETSARQRYVLSLHGKT